MPSSSPESVATWTLIRIQVRGRNKPRDAVLHRNGPYTGVHRVVMMRAQQNRVRDRCWAAGFPRVHMVCVAPRGWDGAVWCGTPAVAGNQSPSLVWREEPCFAPKV